MDENNVLSQFNELPAIDQWQVIMTLSGNMLEIAKDGDWVNVIDIETKRKTLMELFFANEIPHELIEDVKTGIQEIQQTDQLIMDMGIEEQQEFSDKLAQVQQRKSAVSAYNSNR